MPVPTPEQYAVMIDAHQSFSLTPGGESVDVPGYVMSWAPSPSAGDGG